MVLHQQYFKKIKVEGAIYSVHSRNNIIESYSGEFKGIKEFDVTPSISASKGLQSAISHVGAKIYAWDLSVKAGYPDYKFPEGELVILGGAADESLPLTLGWKYDIYAADPLYRAEVFINAKTGEFIKENNLIHNTNTPASGLTLFNGVKSFTADFTGSTYRLRQTVSGGGVQTYSLRNSIFYFLATDITSSNQNSWSDATAIQAHWGAERTWEYYHLTFDRNSFNNAGAIIKSYVHYSTNYVNAFWDGSRMTYGDGDLSQGYRPLVSLDICGHEITHGVTEYSADLNYSYESGALNESFSDIFAECIEKYGLETNDWMMGCEIGVSGCGAFRNMMNPNQFNDPDTYKGTFWYTGTDDNGGVHINSGVQNKWFYILSIGENGTNDNDYNYSVTGIGMDNASAIAYRNLTVYLTPSSNYDVARAGAIQSAIDLYGAGSPEVSATAEAWNAVGVYAPGADTQPPTAPVLSTTSVTQTSVALSWTASTDNVGVTGYDVFVDGVKNNTTNITARTYTVTGLTKATTYQIYVLAKDAAGNTATSNTLSVTTSGDIIETIVAGYYFPANLEGWVPSNTSNCVWTNNAAESGTRFITDNGFYAATVTMNSSAFNSTAKFRISINGSNTTDIIYFDAVTVKGRKNTTGTGNVVTLEKVTKPGLTVNSITGTNRNIESVLLESDEVILYPNPVSNILNVRTQSTITALRIYTSNGTILRTLLNNSDCYSFDVSSLKEGVYIVEIVTDKGTVRKKIIKQ